MKWFLVLLGVILFCPLAYAIDTIIKGDRMELINKGEEVLFSGGVKLTRGQDVMLADEMRTNKRRDKIFASGHVQLFRRTSATETWKAFGHSGFYDSSNGSGYLLGRWKRARVRHDEILASTITRTTDIYGERIDFSREGQKSVATGNVYGKMMDPEIQETREFHAHLAKYYGEDGYIVLTGRDKKPVVTQTSPKGRKKISGKTIIYYIKTRRLISKNEAEAVMEEEKSGTDR